MDPKLCVKCKGRLWCGLARCPILAQKRAIKSAVPKSKDVSAPTPPAVFVSWNNYPKVEIAPMEALQQVDIADDPKTWKDMDIENIVSIRSTLIRPTIRADVYSPANPPETISVFQEIAMSKKPAEIEAILERIPQPNVEFGQFVAPMGPKAPANRIIPQENIRTDKRIEKYYYDEVKAEEAIITLFENGYDVYQLSRILSAGILGIPRNRKLVPTRWAITATDDIIYRKEINKIKKYEQIDDFRVYESHYFDNHFYIILIPDVWGFELLEAWAPGSVWYSGKDPYILSDWEGYSGRKGYANNVGGSYYAARIAIIEHLLKEQRQGRAVVLREVHEGYYMPLGVWQVRENVREALKGSPQVFQSLNEALDYIRPKLRIALERWTSKSALLREIMNQRKITSWL